MTVNPLLDFSDLPRYSSVRPEHVGPAIDQLLVENRDLYEKFKLLRASRDFEDLSQAQRKIVENSLRDYRLGGAELTPREKRRFAEIQDELAALEAKFSENLLDATNAFSVLITDRGDLLGVAED